MYELKITAESVGELRGRLSALLAEMTAGVQLTISEANVTRTPAETSKPPATTGRSRKPKDEALEAVKADYAKELDAAQTPLGDADAPADDQPGTADPSEEASSGSAGTAEPSGLDYHRDVMPAVLRVSKEKGRDTVRELLGGFGVSNAKDVPEECWELLIKKANILVEG